jgi:hypothetical protein
MTASVLDSAFDWIPLSKVEDITGFSERRLRRLVKKHAIGVMKSGREIRFNEQSLLELKDAIRQHPAVSGRTARPPLPRSRRAPRTRSGSELEAALEATTPSPKSKPTAPRPQHGGNP